MTLKSIYHRFLPDRIRFPIGALRRRADDGLLRLRSPKPLPPRDLLQAVQMTPRLREYLEVGQRASAGLRRQLDAQGLSSSSDLDVLDFGCGLGRTLRFFDDVTWRLAGCDVDPRLIEWCRRSLPGPNWQINAAAPPLPFEDASFDVLWSVSVFTHFEESEQLLWADEIARVMRPGGVALISLMGPHALGAFPPLHERGHEALSRVGFFFEPGGEAFNQRGAFHTADGVERLFGELFTLSRWVEAGLDGFQDLAVLERQ